MIPELEKPRITEIQVRIDCNGCVQKIKKALHGINGIYDIYIDFPQQKLTIIGWADPERIIKAIKKTRKIATICSHTEATDPTSKPPEQAPDQASTPATDGSNPSSTEPPPQEPAPPTEPPKDTLPPPPPPENPQPTDPTPPPVARDPNAGSPVHPVGPKDVEVHVIYHDQHDYGYRYAAAPYDYAPGFRFQNSNRGVQYVPQPPPVSVTHSYNTYKPSPYVTEYEYVRAPSLNRPSPYFAEYDHGHSPPSHVCYSRMDRCDEGYQNGSSSSSSSNGNITSIFSDENPNACRIM